MSPDRMQFSRALSGFLIWTALAAALRFSLLGHWSLWGDESFTLDDSLRDGEARRAGARLYPVLYWLTRLSLDHLPAGLSWEWRLRFVPALAGSLAAGAGYLFARRACAREPWTAHVLAAYVTMSPWLLFHSQFARFYTLLVLFSTLAARDFLAVLEGRHVWASVRATVWLFLACLTHPCALFLVAGLGGAAAILAALRESTWIRGLAPPVVTALLWLLHALLHVDSTELSIGAGLTSEPTGADGPISLAMRIAYNFDITWCLLAFLGYGLLRKVSIRLFWASILGGIFPIAVLLTLAAFGRPVFQRYLLPSAIWIALPAAYLVACSARRLSADWPSARVWVLSLALLPMLPGTISQYVDGDRPDLRAAITLIRDRWQSGNVLICESHGIAEWYFPELQPDALFEAPLEEQHRSAVSAARSQTAGVWVVIPATYGAMPGTRARFLQWCQENGHLVREFHRRRFDYHQNRLLVFVVDRSRFDSWSPSP